MKKMVFLLIALCVLIGCSKDEDIEYRNAYKKSYDAWQQFKQVSGNSYQYMITSISWTGYRSYTTISVAGGKVVQREYEQEYWEQGVLVSSDGWTEYEDKIGTRQYAAAAITLDEVYHMAKNEWLQKRNNAELYFEANNNGMISLCGYRDTRCADDCFIGISIAWIEPLYLDK